jgi:transcriptional regulator with XRE-family HTH domain
LEEARKNTDLSQERLGVLARIDKMSASARMNQYERGKHEPEFTMVERIAKVFILKPVLSRTHFINSRMWECGDLSVVQGVSRSPEWVRYRFQ